MDFNSLGNGQPFYVLRKGEKPILEVGSVKSKSQPRAKFNTSTPNVMIKHYRHANNESDKVTSTVMEDLF